MSAFVKYIGIPWEQGATGPDTYDCMAFMRHIQGKYFGIEMAEVLIPDYDNGRELVGLLNGHAEKERWLQVEKPIHGDAVLVRSPLHFGIWLNIDGGGVLHCVRGAGVIFTADSSWRLSGFGGKQYLRHVSRL